MSIYFVVAQWSLRPDVVRCWRKFFPRQNSPKFFFYCYSKTPTFILEPFFPNRYFSPAESSANIYFGIFQQIFSPRRNCPPIFVFCVLLPIFFFTANSADYFLAPHFFPRVCMCPIKMDAEGIYNIESYIHTHKFICILFPYFSYVPAAEAPQHAAILTTYFYYLFYFPNFTPCLNIGAQGTSFLGFFFIQQNVKIFVYLFILVFNFFYHLT